MSLKLRKHGLVNTPAEPIEIADKIELKSFIKNVGTKLVSFGQVMHENLTLFNARLVCDIKGKETNAPYEKSRVVIAAWKDLEKAQIQTQSLTLQRAI